GRLLRGLPAPARRAGERGPLERAPALCGQLDARPGARPVRAVHAGGGGRLAVAAQFMQAPVPVAVLVGPQLIIDMANPRYEKMVGRSMPVGRPFREAFPELPYDHPVFAMVGGGYGGQPYAADEYKVPLRRPDGTMEDTYFKFRSEPLR